MKDKSNEFINILYDSMYDYIPRQSDSEPIRVNRTYFRKTIISLCGIWDFIVLLSLRTKISRNQVSIYYTHSSFIKFQNNHFDDTLFNEILERENSIFISYDKCNYFHKLNGIRVYNIGVIVKVLKRLRVLKITTKLNNYNEWKYVNNLIVGKLSGNKIFIPSYSTEPGLSLVFNQYRKNYILIEIQHGNVINYPPYSFIANLPIVDVFYCRDLRSKLFLEDNLFHVFRPKLFVLNQKQVRFLPPTDKVEILYVSSYEFSTFHPVFEEFLFSCPSNWNIKIRLHPRQVHLEDFFIESIRKIGVNYEIDKAKFWFEAVPSNILVVSPFSSVVEESVNLGLTTIIIDSVGAKRYEYLIDNKLCFFSENLEVLIGNINK